MTEHPAHGHERSRQESPADGNVVTAGGRAGQGDGMTVPGKSVLRRLFELFASGRLAVWLIFILVLLLLLYLLVPQAGISGAKAVDDWVQRWGVLGTIGAAAGLTDIQRSLALWMAYSFLFVNISLCMVRRLGSAWIAARPPAGDPRITRLWTRRDLSGPAATLDRIAGILRRKGFLVRELDGTLHGIRGRFAVLGSWVFHVGILVVMAAGFMAAAAPDPFRGSVGVGEGEPFDIHASRFLGSNQPVSEDLPDLAFTVEDVHALAAGEDVREFRASVRTDRGERFDIGVNRPLREPPYQVLATSFGYMPGWAVVDARGRMLRGAWIKLAPYPLEDEEILPIGPRTSEVRFRFIPPRGGSALDISTPDSGPEGPGFQTRITVRGIEVYDGVLAPGQKIRIGGGRSFHFLPEVRKYVILDVVSEGSYPAVFFGFGLIISGLFLRYARIRKELFVRPEGSGLAIFGRSEMLEALFEEEMDGLIGDIERSGARLVPQEMTS